MWQNILFMNARTPFSLPTVGDTSSSTIASFRTIVDPTKATAQTQKTKSDQTVGIEESFGQDVDAHHKTISKVEVRNQETIRSAPHCSFAMDRFADESYDSRMAEKPTKLSASIHDISSRIQQERNHQDIVSLRSDNDPIGGQRATPRLPEHQVESAKFTTEQRRDILPSSFYDPLETSSLSSGLPIQKEVKVLSLESQKSQPNRCSGNERDDYRSIIPSAASHEKLYAKNTNSQKTFLSKSHPYAESDLQEWKYRKNVPLYSLSTSESSRGEKEGIDYIESHMTERPSRLPTFSEPVEASPIYTGFHSEGSMPSRDIQHRLHGGKCLPKEGFLHNQRGVDFFQNEQRLSKAELGPTVNDWTSTKQKASLAMQERFRL